MKNRYWHIQMFLPEGKGGTEIDSSEMLKEHKPIIGTGEWDNFQCYNFKGGKDGLTIDDIIMVREGNKPLALCRIIGNCFHDDNLTNKYINYWFRHVEILGWAKSDERCNLFSQGTLNILHKRSNTRSWNYINDWYIKILQKEEVNMNIDLLLNKKQVILQGAPGTGKTYRAKDIAEQLIFGDVSSDKSVQTTRLQSHEQFKLIQFHSAYTYEDFVRGIEVKTENGQPVYITRNKLLAEFSSRAQKKSEKPYILIIDEINRANLPAVLGELIYALEYRGEKVESMYAVNGDNALILPPNVYIIGTMNTADRSIGQIDYAIRRRFAFVDMLPKSLKIEVENFNEDLFKSVSELFIKDYDEYLTNNILIPSSYLSDEFRLEDVWLGHSYFIMNGKNEKDITKTRLQYEIIPILKEYIKDGIFKDTDGIKAKIVEIENKYLL